MCENVILNNHAPRNHYIISYNVIVLKLEGVYALDAMGLYNTYQCQKLNRKLVQTFLISMNRNKNPNNNLTMSNFYSLVIVIKNNLDNIIQSATTNIRT